MTLILCFSLFISSCEDGPQEVGVYDGPVNNPGQGSQKVTPMDASEIKVSILNLENLGDTDFESGSETNTRISNIRTQLLSRIISQNDVYFFLGIIGEKIAARFINLFDKSKINCLNGKRGETYTLACHKNELKFVREGSNFNDNSTLPMFNARFQHEDFNLDFYISILDYSNVNGDSQERLKYTEQISDHIDEHNQGLPTMIIGDWRTQSDSNEMNNLFTVVNKIIGNMDLLEADDSTVINTDQSNSVIKKYNNVIFNSVAWTKESAKNIGACNRSSGQAKYQKDIGSNCPTMFVLKSNLSDL